MVRQLRWLDRLAEQALTHNPLMVLASKLGVYWGTALPWGLFLLLFTGQQAGMLESGPKGSTSLNAADW